jgi:hypothetical protein
MAMLPEVMLLELILQQRHLASTDSDLDWKGAGPNTLGYCPNSMFPDRAAEHSRADLPCCCGAPLLMQRSTWHLGFTCPAVRMLTPVVMAGSPGAPRRRKRSSSHITVGRTSLEKESS